MRLLLLSALSAATLAVLPAAAAEPARPPRPMPEQMEAGHAEMEAKRSADIALLLGLGAAQRPALDAYLKTMEPPHHRWGEEGAAPPPPAETGTLARLDRMSQEMDRHQAEAKQRIDATRRFYASLSPEQQQRFDALERLKHEHGGPHGMHGPEGHGGPGGPDGPPPAPMG